MFLILGPSQETTKQENPFSFKHFLRDSAAAAAAGNASTGLNSGNNNNCNAIHSSSSSVSGPNSNNISHSRSTSLINGTESHTPSKSATTSALSQNHSTGARPKIPQFQSVHALAGGSAGESKMKRSPRFPSFDSQSSLSELSDERSNLFHSCSNSSFNSSATEHPVQRSFSNYDIESPTTHSPKYDRKHGGGGMNHSVSATQSNNLRGFVATGQHRVATAEISAALPDFVQDHIVMEQWYHGLGSPKGSNSPVSVDFDNLPDFTINPLDDAMSRPRIIDGVDAFDMSNHHSRNRTPARNPSPVVPLDLPMNRVSREQAPPDLPPDLTEGQRGAFGYGGCADINRDQSSDKFPTLPDFLSDGPIHSSGRLADVTQDTPHFNSPDEISHSLFVARLQSENDELRREAEANRQLITTLTCRISELEILLPQRRHQSRDTFEGAQGGQHISTDNNNLIKRLKEQIKQLQVKKQCLNSLNST